MAEVAEAKLVRSIKNNLESGKISRDVLQTDDRVLARITDGIYRQPGSAIRELIANAYDADATDVWIQTGIPDFRTMSVRDNGNGMSVEALARLIHHIGGSAKRLVEGRDLGIVNRKDSTLSPRGRRLIGKIGIGLFSVSQLTRHFQIITKTKGSEHRHVAEVLLHTYQENEKSGPDRPTTRQTGEVLIKSVPASDKKSHGTEIVLLDIKPQTQALLQSQDLWAMLDADQGEDDEGLGTGRRKPPSYHIGRYRDGQVVEPGHLPWLKGDPPSTRFGKMFQAVVDEIDDGVARPRLDHTFDTYLRMLWNLSLSAPLDYIEKHPFDLASADNVKAFQFDFSEGQAKELELGKGETIRSKLGYRSPERGVDIRFRVIVDDVELRRPIRLSGLPVTSHALKTPMVFVGSAEPDLSNIPEKDRGGDLSFEAYFLWAPRIVPTEHNGLLIRIADASGTLFDETFIKYQVSEQTRIRQLTAEIFVREGLDAALNIDRESFNYAHPHYQYMMKWVHRALRQFMTTHKALTAEVRRTHRQQEQEQQANALDSLVEKEYRRAVREPSAVPPPVEFTSRRDEATVVERRRAGGLVFEAEKIFPERPTHGRRKVSAEDRQIERQVKGIAQLLEAYGVFDSLPPEEQEELLRAVAAILRGAWGE